MIHALLAPFDWAYERANFGDTYDRWGTGMLMLPLLIATVKFVLAAVAATLMYLAVPLALVAAVKMEEGLSRQAAPTGEGSRMDSAAESDRLPV